MVVSNIDENENHRWGPGGGGGFCWWGWGGGGGVKMDQKVPLKLGATGDAFCATAGKNVPTPESTF